MCLPAVSRCAEQAGALEDNVNTQLAPGQLGRIAFCEDLDSIAVDDDVTAINLNRAGELAMRRVVARQVSVGLGITKVVEGNHIEFVVRPYS